MSQTVVEKGYVQQGVYLGKACQNALATPSCLYLTLSYVSVCYGGLCVLWFPIGAPSVFCPWGLNVAFTQEHLRPY